MSTRFQVSTTGPFPSTPMSETYVTNMPQYTHLAQLPDDCQTLYMQKVGCLIHLATQSRPDLMFSVTQLSRRNKKATRRDMYAVDRTLRYVAGTPTAGQTYCTYGLPPELYATVDVSYNCHADSKSHTGVSLVQLNVLHLFIYLKFSFHFAPLNCCVVELVGLSSSHY